MISGRQIVCLSSVPWGFLPTSRHHLARLFAESNEVLFVDPPGNLLRFGRDEEPTRAPMVEHGRWGRLYAEQANIHRLAPARRLPYGGSVRFRLATPINQRRYAWSVARAAEVIGFKAPVLWDVTMVYFAPRVAGALKPSVHLVHMTDDLWSYPWFRADYERFLAREMETADVAVGTTLEIASRLTGFGVEAHVIGHGVDVDRFAPILGAPREPPSSLRQLERPLIGFAGNIETRVDVELVERLTRAIGTVVLIGPVSLGQAERVRLEGLGVHFTGAVTYDELPDHLRALDVGIVPYRSTELVRRSRPLKLLEMLAAGLPVVCTDMPAARELAPMVRVATSHAEFMDAVAEAWQQTFTDPAERVELARLHSWRERAEELSALIAAVPVSGTSG